MTGHQVAVARDRALPHCGAKTRGGGDCQRPAGWGTDHPGAGSCKLHSGSSRNGRVGAARLVVARDARAALERLGEPVPLTRVVPRLQELAGEADQWLTVCREQVQAMDGDFAAMDNFGAEQTRAMVRQYTEAIDRMHRIGTDLARLGLEERAQRLDELTARSLFEAIDKALVVTLPADLLPVVRDAIADALRGLSE